MEQFPHIPEQPDDYEQARELDALAQDCQDFLEQDERYKNQDKRMRVIAPEWAGHDGIHFQAYLKGSHACTPDGRPVGQTFELGLVAVYPVMGIVPQELVEYTADHEEALPPVERIGGIETKYSIAIYVTPQGEIAWQEQRYYDVCYEIDEDDVPEEALLMIQEDDEEGLTIEQQLVDEAEYIVPLSSGSSMSYTRDTDRPYQDILSAYEAEVASLQPAFYREFAQQILVMVKAEDEGNLALARIFPEDVLNQILRIS